MPPLATPPIHRCALIALCTSAVLSGALCILSGKAVYSTPVRPSGTLFHKPFCMTIIVAGAMASSLPLWALLRVLGRWRRRAAAPKSSGGARDSKEQGLLVNIAEGDRHDVASPPPPLVPLPASNRAWMVLFPLASSDLLVSVCDNVSLMLAPASVTSMVNCSILVFCAVTTRVVLGTRYSNAQCLGVFLAFCGVLVVGAVTLVGGGEAAGHGGGGGGGGGRAPTGSPAPSPTFLLFSPLPSTLLSPSLSPSSSFSSSLSSSLSPSPSPSPLGPTVHPSYSSPLLGVAITLAARLLQSVQFAFEEKYMKLGRFHPLQQVGCEGAIELVLLAAVVLPCVQHISGPDNGSVEDILGVFAQLAHTPRLAALVGLSFVSLALLNPLSMATGKYVSQFLL